MTGPVLVTGAGGFVGGHAVERARSRGLEVVASEGDLRDAAAVRRLVRRTRPAAVLHLAHRRPASPAASWSALQDNLAMAGSVLAAVAAEAPDAPVLVPGSAAQYGAGSPGRLAETAPTVPVTPYGAEKCVLEPACTAAPLRGPVRVIWTRSFNHAGRRQPLDAPVPSWARQVAEAERGGPGALVTGSLDVERDFLDVRDVADAYLELVSTDFTGVVNVCSGRAVALREVAAAMLGLAESPLELRQDPALERAVDPSRVVGDPSRLHALTGWRPRFGLRETLAAVLDEWRERAPRAASPSPLQRA